jgi:hypothetical protein
MQSDSECIFKSVLWDMGLIDDLYIKSEEKKKKFRLQPEQVGC